MMAFTIYPVEYFFTGLVVGVLVTLFVGLLWTLWGMRDEQGSNKPPRVLDAHFVTRPNTSRVLVRRSSLTVNKNTKLLGR